MNDEPTGFRSPPPPTVDDISTSRSAGEAFLLNENIALSETHFAVKNMKGGSAWLTFYTAS